MAGNRYAIDLGGVLEVTTAAALMSPSGMDSVLVGYLDLRGEILPVLGARELLALPSRPLAIADRFVVVHAGARRAAIVVDCVDGVEPVGLVATPEPDRDDGLKVGRRVGAAEGEELVALVDLQRLVEGSMLRRTDGAPS